MQLPPDPLPSRNQPILPPLASPQGQPSWKQEVRPSSETMPGDGGEKTGE
jgi:hypothetical protein